MKCTDCKHWDDEKWSQYDSFELRPCRKAKMYWDASEWSKDEDGEDDYVFRVEVDPSQLMYVQDASDYSATLLTKPDFFCAHFEGREP